ncbi:MAG TPA: 2-phospho-L-lactate guanylyltransferase, partial [Acidimicrobiales bacterium]|nr:2-phospho-L-lactate guanylyltransferase [Acidimicrobiales bacterium]
MVVGTIPRSPSATAAVLVPIKAFALAKQRLASVLDPPARRALAEAMAATVLEAAGSLRTAVVCDDEEVRAWAEAQGAEAIWTPGLGLNGAVGAGVAHLARRGVERVVVAHADLPLAADLTWLADSDGVTLVPDRHGDGTNVACVPAGAGFAFAYGAASFVAHRHEAVRLGLTQRLVPDARLGWDVDVPADLEAPAHLLP